MTNCWPSTSCLLSRSCQVIISPCNRTVLQHIGQERLWSYCHERRQTSLRLCFGLQTVPTSIRSIIKFGAFSKSESIVARYVKFNIWKCVSWRSGACSVRTSSMQQSSNGLFDSEPVWKLTVDTSSIHSRSKASTKRPFSRPQKFQKEIQLPFAILILFP